jgi:hypothetical protein
VLDENVMIDRKSRTKLAKFISQQVELQTMNLDTVFPGVLSMRTSARWIREFYSRWTTGPNYTLEWSYWSNAVLGGS